MFKGESQGSTGKSFKGLLVELKPVEVFHGKFDFQMEYYNFAQRFSAAIRYTRALQLYVAIILLYLFVIVICNLK